MLGFAAGILLLVQAPQSSLTGTVTDGTTKAPLAGVVVSLGDRDRFAITDSVGWYRLTDVPTGSQRLIATRAGYIARALTALVPPAGNLRLNLVLMPAAVRLPALVVSWTVPIRGLDLGDSSAFVERRVSLADIRADPLLAEPDGFAALSGGALGTAPEVAAGISVRGAPNDATGYLLDGFPVFSPYHAGGTFSAWNPDALDRVEVSSAVSDFTGPDALSGTVSARTRTLGHALAEGSISSTQARVVAGGPLGRPGAGYLLSYRSGFPGILAPRDEPSYLQGHTSDLLSKVELRAGGRLRLLFYDSDNRIDGASRASGDPAGPLPSNHYQWHSQTAGIEWSRLVGKSEIRLRGWTASSDADAVWSSGGTGAVNLTADRRDGGITASAERREPAGALTLGTRLQWSGTEYRLTPLGPGGSRAGLSGSTPLVTVFLNQRRTPGRTLTLASGWSATFFQGQTRLGLGVGVAWAVSPRLSLSATMARSHQYVQSLRNPESMVGTVFPADLSIGAGAPGVPVARGDRAVLGAGYRPRDGTRISAEGYLSRYTGLLLVAPRTGEPFATGEFTMGSALVPGFSLEAGLSRPHYGLRASYRWQRVRLTYEDSSYTPGYGQSHEVEAGAIVLPRRRTAFRLGAVGIFGRRATAVDGNLEWESCNLLDRGCEFGGSPRTASGLGDTALPAYVRIDLGFRQEWQLELGRRQMTLAFFATLTNLLSRSNVLTVAADPATGRSTPVEMRPFAPLVMGLDWRF